jgi:hypothetical protein
LVARERKMSGGCRKLHNGKHFYFLLNIIRVIKSPRMRWASHMACIAEIRNALRILVGKPEGKRPCGRQV